MNAFSLRAIAALGAAVFMVGCEGSQGNVTDGQTPVIVDPNTGNHHPQIVSFGCNALQGYAPFSASCGWQVSDQDNEPMSCRLDTDSDGVPEFNFDVCPSQFRQDLLFPKVGSSSVTLTVFDQQGARTDSTLVLTTLETPNNPPVILTFTPSATTGFAPLSVTFDIAVADNDQDPMTCTLSAGGTVLSPSAPCGIQDRRTVILTRGVQNVELVVTDAKGASASQTVTITVNEAPAATLDLRISRIEWGQSVISTTPRLVAGKDALLRIYVLADKTGANGTVAKAEIFNGGQLMGEVQLLGPSAAPTTELVNDLTKQYRGTVPAKWMNNGLSVRVVVDPANAIAETNEANNELSITPTVGPGNVLVMTDVPVTQGGRTGKPMAIEQTMQQLWPVRNIATKTRATYTFGGTLGPATNWDVLLDDILTIKQQDNSNRDYLGWVDVNFGSGIAGIGYVGIGAALARDDSPLTAEHELGHNMGRNHAPCGGAAGIDRSYPVSNARLDAQGWDFVTQRLLPSSQYYDIMSYCEPQWVSSYNYRAVQAFLEQNQISTSSASTAQPKIVFSGIIEGDQVKLNAPVSVVTSSPIKAQQRDLTLAVAAGGQLHSIAVQAFETADGATDQHHFSVMVPDLGPIESISLFRGDTLLARRVAPIRLAAPRADVAVRPVAGGVLLTWNAAAYPFASISHLSLEEHTTLSLHREGGSAFVSTEGLEPGGVFEVSVSDGVRVERVNLAR